MPTRIIDALNNRQTVELSEIASAIERFAPLNLQENYDNAGLQVGDMKTRVEAVLLCLDVTEDILEEAIERGCNLIITHHPLIFKGIKHLTGKTATERIITKAIRSDVAIYSAHTNLDSTFEGVSYEMAHRLGLRDVSPLCPNPENAKTGLGVIGAIKPTPTLEFLRKVKDTFKVKSLKFSDESRRLVVRRIALCGGAGGSLINDAIRHDADIYVTGDLKYHDFTTNATDIILADIGHYESELCSLKIFSRILRENFPGLAVLMAETETNPIKIL